MGRGTFAASAIMLIALSFLTVARAQDADESVIDEAKKPPSIAQVAGTWSGTDTQSGSDPGSGPMTLDIMQSRQKLSGIFSVTTGGGSPSGSFIGTIKGDALHATFHATGGTNHPCNAEVAAVVDGDQMTGTFVVHGSKRYCAPSTGTFNLTKQ